MAHLKHPKLAKPLGGLYHTNELGFIGAPCDIIDDLYLKLKEQLVTLKLAYVTADHHVDKSLDTQSTLIDRITHLSWTSSHPFPYIKRPFFAQEDLVVVNGNHFESHTQVILLNANKQESLAKKLHRLTHPIAIIADDIIEPYPFLEKHIAGLPIFHMSDLSKFYEFIHNYINARIVPTLEALILAGGKSQRMGQDKAQIEYHGTPQYKHLIKLCEDLNLIPHVSIAGPNDTIHHVHLIEDKILNLGPYGAIISAFMHQPNHAYLSLPCDAPNIDQVLLQYLIKYRNPHKVATALYNPETEFPEPLITIWEPKAYPILLQFLAMGYSCPRKVLINSDIELIPCPSEKNYLVNINTPEEKAAYIKKN